MGNSAIDAEGEGEGVGDAADTVIGNSALCWWASLNVIAHEPAFLPVTSTASLGPLPRCGSHVAMPVHVPVPWLALLKNPVYPFSLTVTEADAPATSESRDGVTVIFAA